LATLIRGFGLEILVMILENELRGLAALFSALMMAIGNTFPAVRTRRAISNLITIVIIIVIIVAGAAVILTLVIFPGQASTTTIYP
jgi:hypothetical protein